MTLRIHHAKPLFSRVSMQDFKLTYKIHRNIYLRTMRIIKNHIQLMGYIEHYKLNVCIDTRSFITTNIMFSLCTAFIASVWAYNTVSMISLNLSYLDSLTCIHSHMTKYHIITYTVHRYTMTQE